MGKFFEKCGANILVKALGRVATNIRSPYGIVPKIKTPLGKIIKAIKKDTPSYSYNWQEAPEAVREFLYRKKFGLNPRAGKNLIKEIRKGEYTFTAKDALTGQSNPLRDEIKAQRIREQLLERVRKDKDLHYKKHTKNLHIDIDDYNIDFAYKGNKIKGYHSVLGDYKKTKDTYWDSWDWKLNPGERKIGLAPVLRTIMDKITDPVIVRGKIFGKEY